MIQCAAIVHLAFSALRIQGKCETDFPADDNVMPILPVAEAAVKDQAQHLAVSTLCCDESRHSEEHRSPPRPSASSPIAATSQVADALVAGACAVLMSIESQGMAPPNHEAIMIHCAAIVHLASSARRIQGKCEVEGPAYVNVLPVLPLAGATVEDQAKHLAASTLGCDEARHVEGHRSPPQPSASAPIAASSQVDDTLVAGTCAVLMSMESQGIAPPNRTCFHAKVAPKVSVEVYLARIRKHVPCSDACFAIALVYIDRICRHDGGIEVSKLTLHRLILTAIVLATKFYDDDEDVHYHNAYFAKVGGISVQALNILEVRFLELLEWKLQVPVAEYEWYHARVRGVVQTC